MNDLISRQAAIDIERNATVDTNPSHFEAHQKFTQFMDDAEISSFGRWQWSNGFNTALTAVGIDLKKMPSAQPEIVRCGECKWWDKEGDSPVGYCHAAKHSYYSEHWEIEIYRTYKEDFFCADGERRSER